MRDLIARLTQLMHCWRCRRETNHWWSGARWICDNCGEAAQ